MGLRTTALCAAVLLSPAGGAATPPCAAPAGIAAPAVPESMCSREVARSGGIAVREMGLPAAETLVAGSFEAPQWGVVIDYGVRSVLDYFAGDNAQGRELPGARTTPVTFRQRAYPNGTVYEWTSAMMASTAQFPDPAALPAGIVPLRLERVGRRLIAAVQFTTAALPSQLDFAAACGGITPGALPPGYAPNASSPWTPTYAIYSAEKSPAYECECWVEVSAG